MDNLKEFEVKDLSKVVGGDKPKATLTVHVTGVLDGIPHNTKVDIDGTLTNG
ncbi:hypothetical protein I5M32_04965 [Pedobacter sp. SD-b]|uniref:Bacteriocin-type signal sequence-containing protein n=1 Tax=Pedobacter segetis TaxID=2793069 RepID=A0ABS1BHI2_9SPHI|nr:hypothetical protein [Pedobacter segetis]MBK0382305.1 hypothetical protein [Pedobacter segetis]